MLDFENVSVVLEEQAIRDGIQNEKIIMTTEQKLRLIDDLVEAGIKRLQICSFVNPKFIPQMADADELCRRLRKREGIVYSGLVLNLKGVERAIDAGLEHIAASIAASDTLSRKNTRMSLPEAQVQYAEMVHRAKEAKVKVRGGLQSVFGCRFEGKIEETVVLDLVKQHLDLGIDELALADSTGMAHPRSMFELMTKVVELAGEVPVILHLHDTEGKGLANVMAAIEAGVYIFDTALGGMGGCPVVKGSTGNIGTEDLAVMLHQMGIDTGIDIRKISRISLEMEAFFNKRFSGKMHHILNNENIEVLV
jgi:hydroxymethylglutaryl-CoA lyase